MLWFELNQQPYVTDLGGGQHLTAPEVPDTRILTLFLPYAQKDVDIERPSAHKIDT